jgi:DNA-3-methyladenine glycosylase I
MDYHDTEWGTPEHDDSKLYEFLVLEGAQAGLSWSTVLKKRENYRKAFDGFDPAKVSQYDARKIQSLLANRGIIRNRLKIGAAIQNAKAVLSIQKEFGSLDAYVWRFVDGKPRENRWRQLTQIPARTKESDEMSRALKGRGFGFVGSTICYAYMQAVGMVNDHVLRCFRYQEVGKVSKLPPQRTRS